MITVTRFFRHPKADRKVMHILLTYSDGPEETRDWPDGTREFYWEPSGYRNRSDADLVEEVRGLLGLSPDVPLACPPFQEAA